VSHPGMELALKRTDGDRSAARHLIRAHIMADAERKASAAACSMKCAADQHVDDAYGCRNDGSGCLCYCHDADAS